jgi:acyl-CoA synthetase (AMP-forming)/AMP-acid ligase II
LNLLAAIFAHAQDRPDAIAVVTPTGRCVSYAEIERLSAIRAVAFRAAGIGPGDVVLIARGVSPDLYIALLAIFRVGAVAMFPEPAAGLKGLSLAVQAAQPKAMVAGALGRWLRPFVPALRGLPLLREPSQGAGDGDGPMDGDPRQPALITFTSGSTGRPKGIVQHDLLEHLRQTSPQDIDLISLPVFILSNLVAGATSVIPAGNLRRPARLDGARLLAQIAQHRVTRILAPPAVCGRLTQAAASGAPPPGGAVHAIFTGGGPVFPNLLHELRAMAPNAALHAVYGSTEAEPIAHLNFDDISSDDWEAMAGGAGLLAGRPISQASVEIVDHEIQVAGPHVNRGYLDATQNASTKVVRDETLWHRTGDAGRFDDRGRLWLLGRREAAARNLFPFAVEVAALSWPGVQQAALLADAKRAILCVAGERLDATDLARRTRHIGDVELRILPAIPLDKRHNSKVDYAALRARVGHRSR